MVEERAWVPPERPWLLSEIEIFVDLSAAEMEVISAAAPMLTFSRGETLHDPHSSDEVLYILKHGRVRSYRVGPDGRSLTTALHQPGDIFGAMVLLGQQLEDTWVETLDPCTVCVMKRDDVERLLMSDPRVAARIAERLGSRIAALERRLSDTILRPVPARIAAALASLAGDRDTSTVRLTHEQLADLVGTGRETTTRVLGELADRSLIGLKRGRIVVKDARGLRDLAENDEAVRELRTR